MGHTFRHADAPAPRPEVSLSAERDKSLERRPAHLTCEKTTVLIVDDEPAILRVVRRILERLDYQVLEGSSGELALRTVETHGGPIHLLVVDLTMHGMGSFELIERARRIRPDMKVLCVSGGADNFTLRRVFEDPKIGFLAKPFTPTSFRAKVETAMEAGNPSVVTY